MRRAYGLTDSFLLCAAIHAMSSNSVSAQTAQAPLPDVQIKLDVVLDSPRCVIGENPTLRIRITNPNSFALTLDPFAWGYERPILEFQMPDGEFRAIDPNEQPDEPAPDSIDVAAGASVERRRFLVAGTAAVWLSGLDEMDQLRLRATMPAMEGSLSNGSRVQIQWASAETSVTLDQGSAREREGRTYLVERAARIMRPAVGEAPDDTPLSLRLTNLYRDFLDHYPDTIYARDVRRQLLKQLRWLIASDKRLVSPDKLPDDLIGSLEACVRESLRQGGPYADEVLTLEHGKLGQQVLEHLLENGRYSVLEELATELDKRGPEDRAAGICLRAQSLARQGSFEEARGLVEILRRDHGSTKFGAKADALERSISRREVRGSSEPGTQSPP